MGKGEIMKKFFTSLQTKLVISFLLLILVITGGTFLITNTQSKKALLDSTRVARLDKRGCFRPA